MAQELNPLRRLLQSAGLLMRAREALSEEGGDTPLPVAEQEDVAVPTPPKPCKQIPLRSSKMIDKRDPAQLGWAIYLRTSSKEVQNPESSQDRQRFSIRGQLIDPSSIPFYKEFADIETGTTADRKGYQQMLQEARLGKFSHIAVENAERFGRNDAEALSVIDMLHQLGVKVRFSDYPELDPIDPDDRIMTSLSFALARRESKKIGERTKGGIHTKLRNGGHTGKAPDGYKNRRKSNQSSSARTQAWIEHDPAQWQVWREAWMLLLEGELTLKEICEVLHERGYTLASGRPFVQLSPTGERIYATSTLSKVFRNWFYAGWVVSKAANIEPKTIRGNWKPVVTTEEFERGLAILKQRSKSHGTHRKHFYLLSNLAYVQHEEALLRLIGSTSNVNRQSGGNAYYCLPHAKINIPCKLIDNQIAQCLAHLQVDPSHVMLLKATYEADSNLHYPSHKKDVAQLDERLENLKQEEMRASRLYSTGKITDSVWDSLWLEWQERRLAIQQKIALMDKTVDCVISDLDEALQIFTQLPQLYSTLTLTEQQQLLSLLIQKVVVDTSGTIVRLELHPPFAYLTSKADALKKTQQTEQRDPSEQEGCF